MEVQESIASFNPAQGWAGNQCPSARTCLKLLTHSDQNKFISRICSQFGLLVHRVVLERSPGVKSLADLIRLLAQELWTKTKTVLPLRTDAKAKLRPLVEVLRRLDNPADHKSRATAFASFFSKQAFENWDSELEDERPTFLERLSTELMMVGARAAKEQFCKKRSFPLTCEAVVKSLETIRAADDPDAAITSEVAMFQSKGVPHAAAALVCALLAEHEDSLGDFF